MLQEIIRSIRFGGASPEAGLRQRTTTARKMTKKAAGLDTSALLRLLVGEPLRQADTARHALQEIVDSGEQANVSDLVLSEAYFALQHHYKVPKKEALEALKNVAASNEIECSRNAVSVLSLRNLHSAKPGFVDRLIHGAYLDSGCRMFTFEKSAKKLEEAVVLF